MRLYCGHTAHSRGRGPRPHTPPAAIGREGREGRGKGWGARVSGVGGGRERHVLTGGQPPTTRACSRPPPGVTGALSQASTRYAPGILRGGDLACRERTIVTCGRLRVPSLPQGRAAGSEASPSPSLPTPRRHAAARWLGIRARVGTDRRCRHPPRNLRSSARLKSVPTRTCASLGANAKERNEGGSRFCLAML